jgi:vacuolar-type H+-ATPase subunit H
MADRNELLQEKAGLVKQQQEILNSANARIEEFVKPIREETDAAISPLSTRVAEINVELLNALDSEAGISHGGEAEACPA